MDRNVNFRTNSRYTYPNRRSSSREISKAELLLRILSYFYKSIEKLLLSDGFAAGFCGIALFLIIGIVGGVEFGNLSLKLGAVLSFILLSSVCVVVYKNNKE